MRSLCVEKGFHHARGGGGDDVRAIHIEKEETSGSVLARNTFHLRNFLQQL